MQELEARKKRSDWNPEPTGNLELRQLKPTKLVIGSGEKEVKFYADGLFEENESGEIAPKRDLEAGVMNKYGDDVDSVIIVGKLTSDRFNKEDCFVTVKITVPVHASIDEGCRKVFIKHKHESLDENGECDSPTCDVFCGIMLLKHGLVE